MRIAVFASGSGSNFAAIIQAIKKERLQGVEVALLVCDRPEAPVILRARQEAIPVFSFRAKDYLDKAGYECEIVEQLKIRKVDLVVLAGYMRLLGPVILKEFEGRVINLHPSLLPAFPGKDATQQALDYGVKLTGVTVHFVDEGMDTGPIIAQRSIEVISTDTKETLSQKIQEQEHELLPKVIGWVAQGLVLKKGRKVDVYEKSLN
jgi:phosphoribosylglycinamide formyltransferase-1